MKIYLLAVAILFSGCVKPEPSLSQKDFETFGKQLEQNEQKISNSLDEKISALESKNALQNSQIRELIESNNQENDKFFTQLRDDMKNLNLQVTNNIKSIKNSIKQDEPTPAKVIVKELKSHKDKIVVGEVEKVKIFPSDFIMDARIDTGAEISSIDAREIEEFERDGKKWVRFKLINRDDNKEATIEREIKKYTKITQSSVKDSIDKRITVSLKITIANRSELADFTLTDREHMSFGVLVGRNILQDVMLVDVSGKFLAPLSAE